MLARSIGTRCRKKVHDKAKRPTRVCADAKNVDADRAGRTTVESGMRVDHTIRIEAFPTRSGSRGKPLVGALAADVAEAMAPCGALHRVLVSYAACRLYLE